MSHPSETLLFLGRFHPVLLHLPIGLLVLLAALEALARRRRFRQANANAGLILALAVPLAAATALCGWLLSLGGGYDARLLQWHKWTGIATAGGCALAALLYHLELKKLYRFFLFSSIPLLLVASHLGGSLTHGSDYLVQYVPRSLRELLQTSRTPLSEPLMTQAKPSAFAAVIQPFLDEKCIACHGPEKAKAALRLDSLSALLKGGETGPVILPSNPAESLALKRMRLPLAHDDHMPPDGKPQPTPEELAFFEWWLATGAPTNKTLSELSPPASLQSWLTRLSAAPGSTSQAVAPKPLTEVLPLAGRLAAELSIPITPLSETEPWLQANAAIAGSNFGNAELAKLAALGTNLRWLDLAGTGITDTGLAALRALPNLARLHLERTGITDGGLACLTSLGQLQYLNLYSTSISDQGLDQLRSLPELKQLYLWQTHVTAQAAKVFADARTDHAKVRAWEGEIEQLKAKIRNQQMVLDLGSAAFPTAPTNNAPPSAACPVSNRPANLNQTLVYEGQLVAFCCEDCKAKFQHDPKTFLARLGLNSNTPTTSEGK